MTATPKKRSVERSQVPRDVLRLCETLANAGFRAWVVGGCIRDLLLGKQASDWDLCTDATPEQIMATFRRTIPTGVDHGTVTVLSKGQPYEVTTLRGEGAYSDGRRPDEVFFVSDIEQDLARRDFTVNAIAFDPVRERLEDPFDGLGDMDSQRLRAVGDARERFNEDGLRVLRAARFVASLEFELDPDTEAAIEPTLETFRKVSPERVNQEWRKIMLAPHPSRAFEVMRRTGILSVTYPELLEQVGCEQNRWHAYDVWNHTMAVLDAGPPDPVIRLALLLHDVAKPRTRQHSEKTNDWTFYNHERVGADMAAAWLKRYRFSNAERETIVALIRHHLICYSPDWSDAAVRRFVKRVGPDLVPSLLEVGRADALGKGRPVPDELAALDDLEARIADVASADTALRTKDLAIGGQDVMQALQMPPGRRVGRLLEALLERVIEDPDLNRRESLLAMLNEVNAGLDQ